MKIFVDIDKSKIYGPLQDLRDFITHSSVIVVIMIL